MMDVWSLPPEKMVCLTSDNGSNMIKAAELAGWVRLSCWGHNLHNAVNTALAAEPTVGKAIGACRLVS